MPADDPPLRPAAPEEIAETLSFALRYDGRRRVHHADNMMARITTQRLVEHLERADFVLMRRPLARAPWVPAGNGQGDCWPSATVSCYSDQLLTQHAVKLAPCALRRTLRWVQRVGGLLAEGVDLLPCPFSRPLLMAGRESQRQPDRRGEYK